MSINFSIFLFLVIVFVAPLGIAIWLFLRRPLDVIQCETKEFYSKYGNVFLGLILLYGIIDLFILRAAPTKSAIIITAGLLLLSFLAWVQPLGTITTTSSVMPRRLLSRIFLVLAMLFVLEVLLYFAHFSP